jgi:predicted DNA-binding transcriptional regulator YafY
MQILSYGDNAYVLKPKKLAEEIKDILKCTLGYYE